MKSKYGKINDDGESIVDINSGYEIAKRDFVNIDEYNEEGFKIITNKIIEKDVLEKLGVLLEEEEEEEINDSFARNTNSCCI